MKSMENELPTRSCSVRARLLLSALLLLSPLPFRAQTSAGTLRVQVTDPSGSAVPGASLKLATPSSAAKPARTDLQGVSLFRNLEPGVYTVEAAAKGFAPYQLKNYEIIAGRTQALAIPLVLATTTEQLTINDNAKLDVDPSNNAGALVLRKSELEALSDDRTDLAVDLQAVTAGDRAVIVGPPPADPRTWVATAVLVMTRSDVASLQQKDQEDWKKRGTTGMVTAVDPAAGVVTIRGGQHTSTVRPSEKTAYLRYSPDSPRFADARPSTFAEIKTGDQMRVLGNRNEDGATIQAERVVSGSFRQIAATITAVNPQTGELTVKDLATKKPLTLQVDSDSTMKKLPEQAARTLARRYAPGAQPAGAGTGAGDVSQMLDNLPAMPLSELKPGDAIMVSTTQGSTPGRVTAIMLLAGVEPLLTASSTATRDILSGWSIGGAGDTGQ